MVVWQSYQFLPSGAKCIVQVCKGSADASEALAARGESSVDIMGLAAVEIVRDFVVERRILKVIQIGCRDVAAWV